MKTNTLMFACALAATTSLAQQGAGIDDEKAKAAALAKATLNPIASLISLPLQNNFDWGVGRMATASNTS